jgi:uncharacterized protein (DUF983 family)
MIELDASPPLPQRPIVTSLKRGFAQQCPACGQGALYRKYLKVVDTCPVCSEELFHQRADDAPPYFTIVIVAHVIVGAMLVVEQQFAPPSWLHMVIWLPLTLIMSLWLLPRVKGSLIGLQWALRMHGFGGEADEIAAAGPGG